jgi:hypothetical protein
LPDFVDVWRRLGGGDGFELVRPGLDSRLGEAEAKVGDVCAAENTFFKIDFDAVRD